MHDNPKLPIFDINCAHYSAETIVRCLLNPPNPHKIAAIQPLSVQRNATFIVDCSKLSSIKDLTADDNGAWQPTGKPCTWFKVIFDENKKITIVYRLDHRPSVNTKNTFALFRYYGRHSCSSDFRRMVATLRGMLY